MLMMASSQEKAVALKDAYVQGIMDGEIASKTANAFSALPEQNMGDTASIHFDINRGNVTGINDGDARIFFKGPRGSFAVSPEKSNAVGQMLLKKGAEDMGVNLNVTRQMADDLLTHPVSRKGYGARKTERMDNEDRMEWSKIYHGIKNQGLY